MRKGDKVIWDSGFGYDIAILKKKHNQSNSCVLEMKSGSQYGKEIRVSQNEVSLYTKENIANAIKEYGCEKTFSEVF